MSTEQVRKVLFKKIHPDAVIPAKATPGSSGADLKAVEPLVLQPGEWGLVKTGITMEIPLGLEAQVRSRSGLALKQGLFVLKENRSEQLAF